MPSRRLRYLPIILGLLACVTMFALLLPRVTEIVGDTAITETPFIESILEPTVTASTTLTTFPPELSTQVPSVQPSETPTVFLTSTPAIDLSALFSMEAPSSNGDWKPIEYEISGNPVVFVPAGCFSQGVTQEQIDEMCLMFRADDCQTQFEDEMPAHNTCLSPFWLDKYETSQKEYGSGETTQPQTQVTWQQADQHCRRQNGYLVTEAQWEYAARGPENRLFTTDIIASVETVYIDKESPVASNHPTDDVSWVGAFHMNGNVREWVFDTYVFDSYSSSVLTDPVAQSDGQFRVVRGGGWTSRNLLDARLTNRNDEFFDNSAADIGFRCAYPVIAAKN